MDYKHDIFISYIRDDETLLWLNRHFIPLLKQFLKLELGYKPEIFLDVHQIETGVTWPISLGENIGNSRILIALWTKTYLNSNWCTAEMSHMLKREFDCGYRQDQNSNGLVIPVIVHDGETLPPPLLIGQTLDIKDCFNSRMSIDSPKAEVLADRIKEAAVGIAHQIMNVPKWKEDWNIDARNNFYTQYYKNFEPTQIVVPRYN